MMELIPIQFVSKQFNISTRTLRYYEQLGLIQSVKNDGYSYRTYESSAIERLRQIIFLRKLRIPLKRIGEILNSEDSLLAIETFTESIIELDDEITALSMIRSILHRLIAILNKDIKTIFNSELLSDDNVLDIVDSLTASRIKFKEDKTMEDLNKANKKLKAVAGSGVRVVYLPPATVAAIHIFDSVAEHITNKFVNEFIRENKLGAIKPDFRHYGFDHNDESNHGYERWVTIPDAMEVKEPFVKKQFIGGIYGARTIDISAVVDWGEEWDILSHWVMHNDDYGYDGREPKCNNGLLEEHLNYINRYMTDKDDGKLQLDLLMPAKPKIQ